MAVAPEDFPRGFAECSEGFKSVRMNIAYGDWFDAGIRDYGEFFTCLEYGWELLSRPVVTLDGVPGRVRVVHRFTNAVQLKWYPVAGVAAGETA